jgi:PAS domain-containing protein
MPNKPGHEEMPLSTSTTGQTSPRQDTVLVKDYALASSINGIAIGDLAGVVTYVNNAAVRMWGADDPSEMIGKPATVFAQSEQEALTIMATILEKGEWSGEITGRRKNDLPITVLLSASW